MRKVFVLAMLAMVAFAFTACNKTKAVEENDEDVYEKVSLADLFQGTPVGSGRRRV